MLYGDMALLLPYIVFGRFWPWYVLQCFCLFKFFVCFFCPYIAINNNVSVQYNGGLLPDIMLLTQCCYHRGTRLNAIKRFCLCSL